MNEIKAEVKGKIKVTDIYGNEKVVDAINFTSSGSPVYVEIIDWLRLLNQIYNFLNEQDEKV